MVTVLAQRTRDSGCKHIPQHNLEFGLASLQLPGTVLQPLGQSPVLLLGLAPWAAKQGRYMGPEEREQARQSGWLSEMDTGLEESRL